MRGGTAILNYNLPQSTAYDVVSYIKLDIPIRLFKDSERKAPPGNYWERFDQQREKDELTPQRIGALLRGQAYTSVSEVMNTGPTSTPTRSPRPRA